MQEMPAELRAVIKQHHLDSASCSGCVRPCCAESGFALYTNVKAIYQIYLEGKLLRNDYTFLPDLDFKTFLQTYFDPVNKANEIIMFFPKHLSASNNIISLPGIHDYWNYRNLFFKQNSWMNCGCVFQKQKIDNMNKSTKCILHEDGLDERLSAKPIDCVFLTCSVGQNVKRNNTLEALYFQLLSKYFEHERKEFNEEILGIIE